MIKMAPKINIRRKFFGILLFLAVSCVSILNNSGNSIAYETITTTGPTSYCSEDWTLTWGSTNHDKGLLIKEDPHSGDLIWVKNSINSNSSTYGVISRISPEGVISWTKEISGFYNVKYTNPTSILISSKTDKIYLLSPYFNASFGTNHLVLLEYSFTNGSLLKIIPISESFDDSAVMDWDPYGKLIITHNYLKNSESEVNVTLYNPVLQTLGAPLHIASASTKYDTPISINGTAYNDKTILLMRKLTDTGGIYSTYLFALNSSGSTATILKQSNITIGTGNYYPSAMEINAGTIYLLTQRSNIVNIGGFTGDFAGIFNTQWVFNDMEWYDLMVDRNGTFFLLGSGKQAFGMGANTDFQTVIIKLLKETAQFRMIELVRHGDPAFYDGLTSIIETSLGEIFLTGYGKSYGSSTGDHDAYFVKYNTQYAQSGGSSSTATTTTQCKECTYDDTTLMYVIVIGFVVLIGVVAIFGSKNNKNSKNNIIASEKD
jgi:hypothetical protein